MKRYCAESGLFVRGRHFVQSGIGHNWIPKWGNRAMSAYECEDCGEMQYVGKIHSGPVTIGSQPVLNCRHARTFEGLRGEFCRGCSRYISEERQSEPD